MLPLATASRSRVVDVVDAAGWRWPAPTVSVHQPSLLTFDAAGSPQALARVDSLRRALQRPPLPWKMSSRGTNEHSQSMPHRANTFFSSARRSASSSSRPSSRAASSARHTAGQQSRGGTRTSHCGLLGGPLPALVSRCHCKLKMMKNKSPRKVTFPPGPVTPPLAPLSTSVHPVHWSTQALVV